jgi:hypothetical protein
VKAPTTENLGDQIIEGIRATGTRITTTIPRGRMGNELPMVVTYDPGSGLAGVLFGQGHAFIVTRQSKFAFKFSEQLASIANLRAAFWTRNPQAFWA